MPRRQARGLGAEPHVTPRKSIKGPPKFRVFMTWRHERPDRVGHIPGGISAKDFYNIAGVMRTVDRRRVRRHIKRKRRGSFKASKRRKVIRRRRTKRRQRYGGLSTGIASGGDFSHTRVYIRGRKHYLSKIHKAMSIKGKYDAQATLNLVGSTNNQTINYVTYYNQTDMKGQIDALAGGSATATTGCYFNRAVGKLTMVNQDNADCILWIYDCQLRFDSSSIDPVGDWNQGLLDAGSAANALYVPWVTPFKSKKFCERWKVLKVTKRVLSSGAVHTHFVRFAPERKVNLERITSSGGVGTPGATGGIGGFTTISLIVTLGQVTNDSVAKNTVGYSGSKLDVAVMIEYDYLGVPYDVTQYKRVGTLGTVTTADIMNEKTGVIAVETIA